MGRDRAPHSQSGGDGTPGWPGAGELEAFHDTSAKAPREPAGPSEDAQVLLASFARGTSSGHGLCGGAPRGGGTGNSGTLAPEFIFDHVLGARHRGRSSGFLAFESLESSTIIAFSALAIIMISGLRASPITAAPSVLLGLPTVC